jgi:hypothetical protein
VRAHVRTDKNGVRLRCVQWRGSCPSTAQLRVSAMDGEAPDIDDSTSTIAQGARMRGPRALHLGQCC